MVRTALPSRRTVPVMKWNCWSVSTSFTSIETVSPGITIPLNFASSMRQSTGVLPEGTPPSDWSFFVRKIAPAWKTDSQSNTPGVIGLPG